MPHYLIRPEATQLSDPADLSGAVLALDVADPGTVGGLTNGTQYIAQEVLLSPVSAPFAPVAAATPPAQMAAPGLAVADQTITVTLAADPADGGSAITGRDLRYSTDQATWTEQTGIAASTDLAGLDPATTYFVQSRAVNAVGAGTWSAAASAATAALPGAAAITALSVGVQGSDGTLPVAIEITEPGTIHYVVSPSASVPSGVQVKAGQLQTGGAAPAAGAAAASANGTLLSAVDFTGLVGTGFHLHAVLDAGATDSAVRSDGPFELGAQPTEVSVATPLALAIDEGNNYRSNYSGTPAFAAAGGASHCLMVYVVAGLNTAQIDPARTVVTYAGQTCSYVGGISGGILHKAAMMFRLMDPPTGASPTVTVTFKDGGNADTVVRNALVLVEEFAGVDPAAPTGPARTADISGNAVQVAISPTRTESLLRVVLGTPGDAAPFAPSPDTTELFDAATSADATYYNGARAMVGGHDPATTGALTLGTTDGYTDSGVIAVEILPA